MRIIFILSLCFLAHLSFSATLRGRIVHSGDQSGIAGVSVYIPELMKGTVANENGEFVIDFLPEVTVHVQVSGIGYKTKLQMVKLPSSGDLNIELDPTTFDVSEVLVTARQTGLAENTPYPATTITGYEMKKYASPSVMGNLSYQPGVDKITIGNGIAKPVIRGLSFNRILLYTQGTRVENQQWDDHHDLGLSDMGVEQVEIVRGPAALIYGADALGGALVFSDSKPAPYDSTTGDLNFGFASNTLGLNGDGGFNSTKKSGWFYGARLGANSQTSYLQGGTENTSATSDLNEKPFAFNSKFIHALGKAHVGVSKKWGVSKLSYSYFRQLIGIVEDETKDTAYNYAEEANEQREREVERPYQDVASQIISSENTFFTGRAKIARQPFLSIERQK
jgi:iron complex outermembrane receptor protein